MRAGPAVTFFVNAQMEGAVGVGPSVIRIEKIIYAADIGCDGADQPIVCAEAERNGRSNLHRADARDNLQDQNGIGLGGIEVHGGWRMVARVNEQSGVLKSEMSAGAPGAVGLDRKQSLIGPGLHPPGTAFGEDDDFLAGPESGDAAGNGVGAFAATLGGGRDFGELDDGLGILAGGTASRQLDGNESDEENRDREGGSTRMVF